MMTQMFTINIKKKKQQFDVEEGQTDGAIEAIGEREHGRQYGKQNRIKSSNGLKLER